MISQEQFNTWLEDPVTKRLKTQLQEWVEERKEEWATGGLLGDSEFSTAVAGARAIGNIEVCKTLLEWEPDELIKEK